MIGADLLPGIDIGRALTGLRRQQKILAINHNKISVDFLLSLLKRIKVYFELREFQAGKNLIRKISLF